jgi:hypothetical protein
MMASMSAADRITLNEREIKTIFVTSPEGTTRDGIAGEQRRLEALATCRLPVIVLSPGFRDPEWGA